MTRPGFDQISRGSLIGEVFPSLPIPNGVLILFLVAIAASYILGAYGSWGVILLRLVQTKKRCGFRA